MGHCSGGWDFDLRPADLAGQEWNDASRTIYAAVEESLAGRVEKLSAPDGQIAHDITGSFDKVENGKVNLEQNIPALMGLFMLMMQGSKVTFDRRTHRRGRQQVIRLTYVYYAANLLQSHPEEELPDEILEHLDGARKALQLVWGRYEYGRLIQNEIALGKLDERVQERLRNGLGVERFEELASTPLKELPNEDAYRVIMALGQRLQNEIYREVLLGAISQLWVDYLTRVDALRVSIGLEAFAQRDPLVQYKARATEMFAELLRDIRAAVVSRMFTYRPSRGATVSANRERGERTEEVPAGIETPVAAAEQSETRTEKKKKRRRH